MVVQHLWKNKLILIKSILSIVVNNNIKCFNYRWIGGEYGRGGRFPEGCQETRLPKLAGEREYRFLVVCESSSDITNLRDVQSRDIRVLLAGQSSLNTLNVIERVLFTYPSIERLIILPRPPRSDNRHLHLLSKHATVELRKALAFSVFSKKIFMGDYREFEEEALKNPEYYFENRDSVHFRTMAGKHIFTKAVIKSIQLLIDIV